MPQDRKTGWGKTGKTGWGKTGAGARQARQAGARQAARERSSFFSHSTCGKLSEMKTDLEKVVLLILGTVLAALEPSYSISMSCLFLALLGSLLAIHDEYWRPFLR